CFCTRAGTRAQLLGCHSLLLATAPSSGYLLLRTTNAPHTSCLRDIFNAFLKLASWIEVRRLKYAVLLGDTATITARGLKLAPGHSTRPLNTHNKSERRLLPRFRTPLPSRASPAKAPKRGIQFDCQRCGRSRNTRACGSLSGTA